MSYNLLKKQNQLLMRNHQAKPIGLNAVPEAHFTTFQGHKGSKKGQGCGKTSNPQSRAQGRQSS